jgi:hypothetical protein
MDPSDFKIKIITNAAAAGRAVQGVGMRPFTRRDCGFESRRGHGCLSLVNVVSSEVSASG